MFDLSAKLKTVDATPWAVWYELISAYKAEHGHCFIPRLYVTPDGSYLWYWVVKIRQEKEEGLLTESQIAQMDALDFVWKPWDDTWEKGFLELQAYKRKYGDCLTPYNYETDDGYFLGLWVRQQCYFDGNYPREKSLRLHKLGFVHELSEYPENDFIPEPLRA